MYWYFTILYRQHNMLRNNFELKKGKFCHYERKVERITYERGSDKGSFGHFRSCCVIKFQTRLNFQDFACSYNSLKLLLTCNTIKGANNSD